MVRLAQTVHLSYTDTNTVSKWSKTRLHTAHVTLEFHRVRPKWFLSLCYVRRKSSNYVASRLALSPNGMKRAYIWASSPRSTIGCVQNDLWAYGTFDANRTPILRQDKHYLQTKWHEHPLEPRHLGVPSCASIMISEPMVCLAQTMHLSCTNTRSVSNGPKQDFTWPMSPRNSIRCIQNDFCASSGNSIQSVWR
jgi:hypothetical protein